MRKHPVVQPAQSDTCSTITGFLKFVVRVFDCHCVRHYTAFTKLNFKSGGH